jgi:hypothetical protein
LDQTDKELLAARKPDGKSEPEELARRIAELQKKGILSRLGPCSTRQAEVLLRPGRQSLGVEVIVEFLVQISREHWIPWGLAVLALREDLPGLLFKTGSPVKEGSARTRESDVTANQPTRMEDSTAPDTFCDRCRGVGVRQAERDPYLIEWCTCIHASRRRQADPDFIDRSNELAAGKLL